jgi:hypothetical protein
MLRTAPFNVPVPAADAFQKMPLTLARPASFCKPEKETVAIGGVIV